MSKALKIILYALVPYILIAVVIAAWIAFSPAPRYVQQPIFTDVSKIEVRYEDRVVRELTGRSEIAQVLRFLNSRRDGWSTSQPPRRRSSMEVVLFRTSGSKLVLEIQGYTWFIAQDESVFSRLF